MRTHVTSGGAPSALEPYDSTHVRLSRQGSAREACHV